MRNLIIQDNLYNQIKYRENVVRGTITVVNDNNTYGVRFGCEPTAYPNVPTYAKNSNLQIGDRVTVLFEKRNREMPKILAFSDNYSEEDNRVKHSDWMLPVTGTWVLPTGHIDLGGPRGWWNETRMYDGSLLQSSNYNVGPASWSNFIRLTHAVMRCNAIRLYITYWLGRNDIIDIDAFYGGVWNHVFEGDYAHSCDAGGNPLEWYEVAMGSIEEITEFRIRVYNSHPANNYGCGIFEVEFFKVD